MWFGRYARRQTDTHRQTHTQTCSLEYFATAAVGKVMKFYDNTCRQQRYK